MALFNHAAKELTAKIVYYGPGLCGKTSNLKSLHQRLGHGAGKLLSLSTAQDRTIFFDLLPVELGNIKGYSVRFQVCTVPGLSLIHISEPTRLGMISYAVFCLT